MLKDRFNRKHSYLRISLTDHCNLRCAYCMPEEDMEFAPSSQLMQANEIISIAETFISLGVDKIRLTGGEPLVRKEAPAIIAALSALPVALTMTTNGVRLDTFLPVLQQAGIRSVNISLDTLQPDKFLLITKRDYWKKVISNIELMISHGIHVKVNVVVMKGINDNELIDFIAWTKNTPVHVRFIEFMPFSGNQWVMNKVFGWQQILDCIGGSYDYVKLTDAVHDTARKYMVPGHAGTFAVISTITAPFCGDCNRMRLTADGKMKNCLFSTTETDLLTALRRGEDIRPLIVQSIQSKAAERGGQFASNVAETDATTMVNRSMIAIGG